MEPEPPAWTDPEHALAAALDVLNAPLGEILPRLSKVLADLVPHRAIGELTGYCTHSPLKTAGDPELTEKITSAELGRLAGTVPVGRPWQGEALVAGALRPVVAVASASAGDGGALLVVIPAGVEELPERTLRVLQRLWDLVISDEARAAVWAEPGRVAGSRAVAAERARILAELTDAQRDTLTALLGILRSRGLDDATARRDATGLAVSAMIELRAGLDRDHTLSEEPADAAFARLTEELDPLLRYSPVQLGLRAPDSDRPLSSDTAYVARATVRAVVLVMLEQDALGRLHVGWQTEPDALRVTVRDDGPGTLSQCALAVHRITDRLRALDGRLVLDAVPGWGTTVTATLPLVTSAPPTAPDTPLAALGARELEVLEHVARGRRNRAIAEELHISQSTVKFHVANILGKLGVESRGEAAAVARDAGLLAPER